MLNVRLCNVWGIQAWNCYNCNFKHFFFHNVQIFLLPENKTGLHIEVWWTDRQPNCDPRVFLHKYHLALLLLLTQIRRLVWQIGGWKWKKWRSKCTVSSGPKKILWSKPLSLLIQKMKSEGLQTVWFFTISYTSMQTHTHACAHNTHIHTLHRCFIQNITHFTLQNITHLIAKVKHWILWVV